MNNPVTLSATTCPLCQKQNLCTADHSCWCMTKSVPQELIDKARELGIDQQCICSNCIDDYLKAQKKSP